MTQTTPIEAALRLIAALSLPVALMLPASAQSQSLRDRITQRRDGTVGISYPARSGVCGDGRSMIGDADGPDGFTMYLLGENSIMTGTFQSKAPVIASRASRRASVVPRNTLPAKIATPRLVRMFSLPVGLYV